jgi:hypothetical protein
MERSARSLFALPPPCLKILTGQQDNTATQILLGGRHFIAASFLPDRVSWEVLPRRAQQTLAGR